MKQINVLLALMIAFSSFGFSQENKPKCDKIINEADSLFNKVGDLKKSILLYTQAYYECGNKEIEFNLSKAHALLGNKDSAFYHLNNVLEKDSSIYKLEDGDFYLLLDDKRWDKVVNKQLIKYQFKWGSIPKLNISKRLINLGVRDQAYYYYLVKLPLNSKLNDKYWRIKTKINKKNLKELKKIILENKGWPKFSEVGKDVNSAAFLIVQHSDIVTMQLFYRDLRKCVEEGQADKSSLALLTDRMINGLGVKQIYGTQISFDEKTGIYYLDLNDVIDPINLNKRRAEMDLKPIEEYLKNWDAELRNIPK